MRRIISSLLSLLLLILACSFPVEVSDPSSQPLTTLQPDSQGLATQAPTAGEPLNLAGLPLELGNTLRWVDGGLLVYVQPGEFIMGQGGEDNPKHVVYLDGFWIHNTEVTNSMYLRCIAMGECSTPMAEPASNDLEDSYMANLPVVNVRWDQAERYCEFIGGHLPTEAQWEKTARGPDGDLYPWGNAEPTCDLLNFNNCLGKPSSVIAHLAGESFYEVFDMAGNVFEWVADWYQDDYYTEGSFDNPRGPGAGEVRSVRGSAFHTEPEQVVSALRYFLDPDEYRSDLGFRCVVGKAQEFAPPCAVLAVAPPDLPGGYPGSGPGGSATCVVPQPELSVVSYCQGSVRGNNISWVPADVEVDYSTHEGVSCSQYDVDTLACAGSPGGSVYIEACKSCPPPVVQLGVPGSCDPPYVLDESEGLCRYAGDPVPGIDQCTPGNSLLVLPDTVCCELQDGNPFDYPACPPGGMYEPVS